MQVSTIITTYNRAELVCQAIDSVLSQKEPADEILVIDDGSTDDTKSQLGRYRESIRYLYQSNSGISAARNYGVNQSRFDWLAFLDDDDFWNPNKLKRQKEALQQNPEYRVCYTNEIWRRHGRWVNQKKVHKKYSGWIFNYCLPRCIISPSSVILHRSVLDTIGLFDENLLACEDYDAWLRLALNYPILYIDEKLITKRHGSWEQLSKQHSLDKYRILALIKLLESEKLTTIQRTNTIETLHRKCEIYKVGCMKHGRPDEADWARAIRNRFVE